MTIAERERERNTLYRAELPTIVQGLRDGLDPVVLADRVGERTQMDRRETFRWVRSVEESVERLRRRRAIRAVVPVWLSVIAFVSAVILAVTGFREGRELVTYVLALGGIIGAGIGVPRAFRLKHNAYDQWLRREETE